MQFLFLLLGLAIFLFAMNELEKAIRSMAGSRMKRWIVDRTNTSFSSASYGVLITAILQSSSMVSLLVLAFVSAGIIPLFNGIGVVLGANLGTTITGWVATIIGFKVDLDMAVIPLVGIGAVMNLSVFHRAMLRSFGKVLIAIGLLIYGLDIMKESVTQVSELFDISALQGRPLLVYLIVGVVLAAIMQSSSAVMIITLSLLNSDLLQLSAAAALIIGADLGTISTTLIGSIGTSIAKKQLAIAQLIYNIVVNSMAFLIILPILPQMLETFAIQDKMFGLVTFHSLFNILGLTLFLPALKYYVRFIASILPLKTVQSVEFFDVPVEVPEAAIDGLSTAVQHLASDALQLNLLELDLELSSEGSMMAMQLPTSPEGSYEDQYKALYAFEENVVRYANQIQKVELTVEQSSKVVQLLESSRALVYANKTLKDVSEDFLLLRSAYDENLGEELRLAHMTYLQTIFQRIVPLFFLEHTLKYIQEELIALNEVNEQHHQSCNELVTQYIGKHEQINIQVSTWFNLNHEIHHYVRYLIYALSTQHSEKYYA